MNSDVSLNVGLSIADRMAAPAARHAGVTIWYLGQSGFLVQRGAMSVVIDPYLTDSVDRITGTSDGFWVRAYPPPIDPARLCHVDLVLCTHNHLDHTDPETLLAIAHASPTCRFAGPRESVEEMKKAGLAEERLTVLNEGTDFSLHDLRVEPIAAAHEEYEVDAEGHHRYLGYLLHWAGVTLYHAGDTLATPRLAETLARQKIDVAFLPINGRTEERTKMGIVGNMNAQEAIRLAAQQHIDLLIPVHHDLYPKNGATVTGFVEAWEARAHGDRPQFKVMQPGEKIRYQKPDRPREMAVVIGAGKTGRGFLARLMEALPYQLAFVDRDAELVQRLNEDAGYSIHFFGGERKPTHISGVPAAVAGSSKAREWLAHAALAFTAVGEQNLAGLIPDLLSAMAERRKNRAPKLRLVVCENGAAPAAILRQALGEFAADVEIGEAAIFCSTIELPGTRLDIQSESYDELPYDADKISTLETQPGFKAINGFPILLQRKIYTYNCFSACIAYLGAYKGHVWYADAATDAEIADVLQRLSGPLNDAVCAKFGVDPAEQAAFAQAAIRKFSDPLIRDDIERNARDVARKLGPKDRVMAPIHLIAERKGDWRVLALVAAAALRYRGPREKELAQLLDSRSVASVFSQLSGSQADSALTKQVVSDYEGLAAGRSISQLLAKT